MDGMGLWSPLPAGHTPYIPAQPPRQGRNHKNQVYGGHCEHWLSKILRFVLLHGALVPVVFS